MGDEEPDVYTSALIHATGAATEWITSRYPAIPTWAAAHIAKHVIDAAWPYLQVATHAGMADKLRNNPEVSAVADAVEANAVKYLAELRERHRVDHQTQGQAREPD